MATKKISELDVNAGLAGTEEVEINNAGASEKSTTQDVADLAPGGGGTYDGLTDTPVSKAGQAGKAPVVNPGETTHVYPANPTANVQIETFATTLQGSEGNTWTFQKDKPGFGSIHISEEAIPAVALDMPHSTEADWLQDDLRTANVVGGGNITAWIRIDNTSGRFSDGSAVDPVGPALATPATSFDPKGIFPGCRFKVDGVEVKISTITDNASKAIIVHDGVIPASNTIDFIYGTEFFGDRSSLSSIGGISTTTHLLIQSLDSDSGSTVIDRSSHGNSISNSANLVTHTATAAKFGASSLDFATLSNHSLSVAEGAGSWGVVGTQSWTIRFWIKSNNGSNRFRIYNWVGSALGFLELRFASSTTNVEARHRNTSGLTAFAFIGAISTSSFTHFGLAYDTSASTLTYFIDGVAVSTIGSQTIDWTPTMAAIIGNAGIGGTDPGVFNMESFQFEVGVARTALNIVNVTELSALTSAIPVNSTKWIVPNGGTSDVDTSSIVDYNSVLDVLASDGVTTSFIDNGEKHFAAFIEAAGDRAVTISRPGAPGTGVTRNIVSNSNAITGQGAVWAFRDNASVWAAARTDTMAAALNEAIEFANNQMDETFLKLGDANVIQDPELEAAGGDTPLAKGSFSVAIGHNSQGGGPATLSNVRINSDSATELDVSDLKIKQFLNDNTVNITKTTAGDITNDLRAIIIN